ncbi:hypothetical protein GALMADRAFT_42495, partial [Galerina marginata CBS 339.88]
MIGGSLERKEKARRLITQTVNSLTAKMEIGGPMAALYLLGNPDHYTSHKFIPVYWKNYVREVLKSWRTEEDLEEIIPEKLVIQKDKDGKYIGFSAVHDYIYRPKIFENKTLYEWISESKKCKATVETEESEDELNIYSDENEYFDELVSDEDTESEVEEEEEEMLGSKLHLFLKDHPLYKTHKVQFDERKKNTVPNFVGGSLPRCDRGDREYYCATMLTLFKPWRSGNDLKDKDYSWDETFNIFEFSDQQKQYMKHFNVRYECNDARDDYSAQLKKGNADGGLFPQWMNSDVINGLNDDNDFQGADFGDDEPDDDKDFDENKYSKLGRLGKLRHQEMEETRIGVTEAGWLDDSPDGLSKISKIPVKPTISQKGSKWKASIEDQKQKILSERGKNIPVKSGKNIQDPNENNVQVVDRSYLQKSFKAKLKSDRKLIASTIKKFSLNSEQERAFRIIANHSVELQSEQLKMYLGGMGGTGKSQVIKALTEFFEVKNESHRIIVLGPTGSSAALLNGST